MKHNQIIKEMDLNLNYSLKNNKDWLFLLFSFIYGDEYEKIYWELLNES